MVITDYTISNFRNFSEDGASFKLRPVTLLTGANGAGKSSLVKSMCLLKSYFDGIQREYRMSGIFNPATSFLDFTDEKLKLAGFDKVLNKFNLDNRKISFKFLITSKLTLHEIEAEYTFRRDSLTASRGQLDSICLSIEGKSFFLAENIKDQLEIKYLKLNGDLIFEFINFVKSLCVYKSDIESECGVTIEGEVFNKVLYERNYADHKRWLEDWSQGFKKEFVDIFKQIDSFYSDNHCLFEENLKPCIEKCESSGLFYWFPLLEQFKSLSKEECIGLLNATQVSSELDQVGIIDFDGTKARVIENFKNSNFDNFFDYYRSLEDYKLDSFHSCGPNILLKDRKEDFIKEHLHFTLSVECDNTGLSNADESPQARQFYDAYSFMCWICWSSNDDVLTGLSSSETYRIGHKLHGALVNYLELLFRDLLSPDIFSRFAYIGNSFSDVKRIYSYSEKSDFVKAMQSYSLNLARVEEMRKHTDEDEGFKPGSFIKKWLSNLGIGSGIILQEDEDGLGFKINVLKNDLPQVSLADEGHGITQLVSVLLYIENEILKDYISKIEIEKRSSEKKSWQDSSAVLAIEEPEVSLHPSLQSNLALIFQDAAENYGIQFIIETHSEYLIRKTQSIVANFETPEQFDNNPFAVYYMCKDGSSYEMKYLQSGRFDNSFGPGFFDEAGQSSIAVLRRERNQKDPS